MKHKIVILSMAEEDAREGAAYIAADSAVAAAKWLTGLELSIESLSEFPNRFSRIPEAGSFNREYRQLHYHSHRIVFFVDEEAQAVVVARIYHGSRDKLRPSEVETE